MVKHVILNLDPNEKVITEIRRHPIGEFVILTVGLIFILLAAFLTINAISTDELIGQEVSDLVALEVGIGLIVIIMVFSYIFHMVYRSNELIITDQNIIQILQHSIFNKQVSQLNLAKIQDVSVDQGGVLAHFFNYGTINIETAGEAANFKFKLAPDPFKSSKIIVEAHEDFIRKHGVRRGTI